MGDRLLNTRRPGYQGWQWGPPPWGAFLAPLPALPAVPFGALPQHGMWGPQPPAPATIGRGPPPAASVPCAVANPADASQMVFCRLDAARAARVQAAIRRREVGPSGARSVLDLLQFLLRSGEFSAGEPMPWMLRCLAWSGGFVRNLRLGREHTGDRDLVAVVETGLEAEAWAERMRGALREEFLRGEEADVQIRGVFRDGPCCVVGFTVPGPEGVQGLDLVFILGNGEARYFRSNKSAVLAPIFHPVARVDCRGDEGAGLCLSTPASWLPWTFGAEAVVREYRGLREISEAHCAGVPWRVETFHAERLTNSKSILGIVAEVLRGQLGPSVMPACRPLLLSFLADLELFEVSSEVRKYAAAHECPFLFAGLFGLLAVSGNLADRPDLVTELVRHGFGEAFADAGAGLAGDPRRIFFDPETFDLPPDLVAQFLLRDGPVDFSRLLPAVPDADLLIRRLGSALALVLGFAPEASPVLDVAVRTPRWVARHGGSPSTLLWACGTHFRQVDRDLALDAPLVDALARVAPAAFGPLDAENLLGLAVLPEGPRAAVEAIFGALAAAPWPNLAASRWNQLQQFLATLPAVPTPENVELRLAVGSALLDRARALAQQAQVLATDLRSGAPVLRPSEAMRPQYVTALQRCAGEDGAQLVAVFDPLGRDEHYPPSLDFLQADHGLRDRLLSSQVDVLCTALGEQEAERGQNAERRLASAVVEASRLVRVFGAAALSDEQAGRVARRFRAVCGGHPSMVLEMNGQLPRVVTLALSGPEAKRVRGKLRERSCRDLLPVLGDAASFAAAWQAVLLLHPTGLSGDQYRQILKSVLALGPARPSAVSVALHAVPIEGAVRVRLPAEEAKICLGAEDDEAFLSCLVRVFQLGAAPPIRGVGPRLVAQTASDRATRDEAELSVVLPLGESAIRWSKKLGSALTGFHRLCETDSAAALVVGRTWLEHLDRLPAPQRAEVSGALRRLVVSHCRDPENATLVCDLVRDYSADAGLEFAMWSQTQLLRACNGWMADLAAWAPVLPQVLAAMGRVSIACRRELSDACFKLRDGWYGAWPDVSSTALPQDGFSGVWLRSAQLALDAEIARSRLSRSGSAKAARELVASLRRFMQMMAMPMLVPSNAIVSGSDAELRYCVEGAPALLVFELISRVLLVHDQGDLSRQFRAAVSVLSPEALADYPETLRAFVVVCGRFGSKCIAAETLAEIERLAP